MRRCGIVEIYDLRRQGCTAEDWREVWFSEDCDTSCISGVRFIGRVEIGAVKCLRDATVEDCRIGTSSVVANVHGRLRGLRIGRDVTIEDVGVIEAEPEASFGIGCEASVLDETGSRAVTIFPGLSAQLATLMTLRPRWAEDFLVPMLKEKWDNRPFAQHIADGAVVRGCRLLRNVHVGREVTVEGAGRLVNGAIINNAAPGKGLAKVIGEIDAENFIIEDGFAGGGSLLRNVYVGQGASLDKGFTAHDSLFFANAAMENGEACALIAGPYTVSMHKSSLLIGAAASFMNAGSATNFSNHMYKLGPVHWGVLERGVKTSSGAYLMWGARIGAFSLVMGSHKYHPDTSLLPFSYLFGDAAGHTSAAPGLMLRSCGLHRDEQKWPIRDRRLKRRLPLHDHICYEVLNPYTVQTMLRALPLLQQLAHAEPDEHGFVYHGSVALKPTAALKGHRLYSLAITAYLYRKIHEEGYAQADAAMAPDEWMDLCGQIIPVAAVSGIIDPDSEVMPDVLLANAFDRYPTLELCWVKKLAEGVWADHMRTAPQAVVEIESLVEADRVAYKEALAAELALNTFRPVT